MSMVFTVVHVAGGADDIVFMETPSLLYPYWTQAAIFSATRSKSDSSMVRNPGGIGLVDPVGDRHRAGPQPFLQLHHPEMAEGTMARKPAFEHLGGDRTAAHLAHSPRSPRRGTAAGFGGDGIPQAVGLGLQLFRGDCQRILGGDLLRCVRGSNGEPQGGFQGPADICIHPPRARVGMFFSSWSMYFLLPLMFPPEGRLAACPR